MPRVACIPGPEIPEIRILGGFGVGAGGSVRIILIQEEQGSVAYTFSRLNPHRRAASPHKSVNLTLTPNPNA